MLQANWHSVQETANALLTHETLSGVALDAVLSTVDPIDPNELRTITRGETSTDSETERKS